MPPVSADTREEEEARPYLASLHIPASPKVAAAPSLNYSLQVANGWVRGLTNLAYSHKTSVGSRVVLLGSGWTLR